MSNLKEITVNYIGPHTKELRIDLDNDWHHGIVIRGGTTACQLADQLHDLAVGIKRQEYISKKAEETEEHSHNLKVSNHDPDFGGHDF